MLSAESFAAWSPRVAWLDRARAWEVVGWTIVLAVAAILRLASLGDRPLGPDEAQPALAAWRMWLENAPADLGGSVLLLHSFPVVTLLIAVFMVADILCIRSLLRMKHDGRVEKR